MIIQTGNRTDIPAFYTQWFNNRLREGFVLARNPFNPVSVTRYRLDPSVVDLIVFCTKNPGPMLRQGDWDLLNKYHQYWFVTITPYGKDIEPNVPEKAAVMSARTVCAGAMTLFLSTIHGLRKDTSESFPPCVKSWRGLHIPV